MLLTCASPGTLLPGLAITQNNEDPTDRHCHVQSRAALQNEEHAATKVSEELQSVPVIHERFLLTPWQESLLQKALDAGG